MTAPKRARDGSAHPTFLAAGLVENMRDTGDPFLWDLVDALDVGPLHPYLDQLADAIAIRLGKRPSAVTLPGDDA
jgi:hypothetical protein